MKIFHFVYSGRLLSTILTVTALFAHINHATALGVCKSHSANGKGYNMRKSGSELCKSKYNHLRNVDLYIWPGNDKPDCDKVTVYLVSKVEQDAQILAGAIPGCDHVFEISILSTYIDDEICPLFDNNKNFDTDEKRKGAFGRLRQIINAKSNLRQITRELEDAVKTPNVANFLRNKKLDVKAGAQNVNGAIVATNSYLTQTKEDSIKIASQLDIEMKKVITNLRVGSSGPAKEVKSPTFEADWTEFLSLISKESTKVKEDLPNTCKTKRKRDDFGGLLAKKRLGGNNARYTLY